MIPPHDPTELALFIKQVLPESQPEQDADEGDGYSLDIEPGDEPSDWWDSPLADDGDFWG